MLVFLYINIVWFLAGFINGVTSFGGNMFAVPLMTLVMDPKDAIILGCIGGLGITTSITVFYHRNLPKLEFILACVSSIVGVPFGMILLEIAPAKAVLIGCGCILLLFLAWQAVAGRMHLTFAIPMWTIVPVGILSGILLSSTSMGGPILAMYAVMRGWGKEVTLSVLSNYGHDFHDFSCRSSVEERSVYAGNTAQRHVGRALHRDRRAHQYSHSAPD